MHKTAFIYGYLLKQGAGYHLKGTEMPWAGAGIGAGVGAGASGLYDKLRGGKINKTRMAILAILGGAVGGGAQFANKGFRGYKGPAALKELAQSAMAPDPTKAKTMEEFFKGVRPLGGRGELKPYNENWRSAFLGHKMERAPGSEQDFKDWLAKEISSDKEWWANGGDQPTDLEEVFQGLNAYKKQPKDQYEGYYSYEDTPGDETHREAERLQWLQTHLPDDWYESTPQGAAYRTPGPSN